MHAVFLDYKTVDAGDLDLESIRAVLPEIKVYPYSTEAEVLDRIQDIEVAIANKIEFDSKVFNRAKNLKLICVTATGTNNIDLDSAEKAGVTICNIRDYCTESVTQHVLLSILSLSHSYLDYLHSIQRGEWQEGSGFSLLEHPIKELSGKNLGIVGFGVLGRGVAKAASILGMETLICESFNPDKPDDSLDRVGFDELLRESDVVSLHCPLTEETDGIFNDDAFEKMKSSGILINTARGRLVNDQALIKAIENKSIAGAAIDVLDQEPPESDHPLMQKDYKNLIITPHIAWAARESRQRALDRIADNVKAFLKGKPTNVVKASEL